MGDAALALRRCGLRDATVFLLESKRIRNAWDLLRHPPLELVDKLGIHVEDAEVSSSCRGSADRALFHSLSRARAPPTRTPLLLTRLSFLHQAILATAASAVSQRVVSTTALAMKQAEMADPRSVPTGMRTLDALLKGGVRPGTITELVGPPGSCKSHLCMQIALHATLPRAEAPPEGGVLYFDAENHFRAERLAQIARGRHPERFDSPDALRDFLGRVIVSNVFSLSDLDAMIPDLERTIVAHDLRAVVIDNIAVLARAEFAPDRTIQRQALLGRVAARLKRLACAYRLPVVVVNQIMTQRGGLDRSGTKVDGPPSSLFPHAGKGGGAGGGGLASSEPAAQGEGVDYTAALGAKWAHFVNTRLAFAKEPDGQGSLRVAKSPFAPPTTLPFIVDDAGMHERTLLEEGKGGGGRGADPESALALFGV